MDTGIVEGSTISMFYDPMISKVSSVLSVLSLIVRVVSQVGMCYTKQFRIVIQCFSYTFSWLLMGTIEKKLWLLWQRLLITTASEVSESESRLWWVGHQALWSARAPALVLF